MPYYDPTLGDLAIKELGIFLKNNPLSSFSSLMGPFIHVTS